jgi:hypothetical protein
LVDDAVSGIEYPAEGPRVKVWVFTLEVIVRLRPPEVEVAKSCVPEVSPFNDVNPPPDPPSVPQENSPVLVLYTSLPEEKSQSPSPAPKSDEVKKLVVVALPMTPVEAKRLVEEATVEKKLVLVLLVITPLVEKRLVEVAEVDVMLVVPIEVEVELVITEDDASRVPGKASVFTAER